MQPSSSVVSHQSNNPPIIVHHQELLNPDLIGVESPDDNLDPDITHLAITNSPPLRPFPSYFQQQNNKPTRPLPFARPSIHNSFSPIPHLTPSNGQLLGPHPPQNIHPFRQFNPLYPQRPIHHPIHHPIIVPTTPALSYDVPSNFVDPRGQIKKHREISSPLHSYFADVPTTIRLPVAFITFNPKYTSMRAILSQVISQRLNDHSTKFSDAGINNNSISLKTESELHKHTPRRSFLTPVDTNSKRHQITSFVNSFELLPTTDQTTTTSTTTNAPLDFFQTSTSSTTSFLTKLHDFMTASTRTDLITKHDERARTEACRYVSCDKLSPICDASGAYHRLQFQVTGIV